MLWTMHPMALKRQLLQDVIVLNQYLSMLQVVVVCFNFIVFPFFSFAFIFIYRHYQHYHDTDQRSSEFHGSPTSWSNSHLGHTSLADVPLKMSVFIVGDSLASLNSEYLVERHHSWHNVLWSGYSDVQSTGSGTSMPIGNTSSSKSISSAWDYLSIYQFDACRKSNRLDTWLTFDLSQFFGTNRDISYTCSDWSGNDLRTAIETISQWKCIGTSKIGTWSGSLGQVWYDSISARHFRTSVGNSELPKRCRSWSFCRDSNKISMFQNWTTTRKVYLFQYTTDYGI